MEVSGHILSEVTLITWKRLPIPISCYAGLSLDPVWEKTFFLPLLNRTSSTWPPKLQPIGIWAKFLQPFIGPWPHFSFLILHPVSSIPWTGDQPVSKLLLTEITTETQNKRTQTSIPRLRFETTTPAFERTKTVHALDREATVIGHPPFYWLCYPWSSKLVRYMAIKNN
jgi:hypothetical protein